MLEFCKDMRKAVNRQNAQPPSANSSRPNTSASSRAAQAQNSGFARINVLMRQLSAESEASTNSASLDPGAAGSDSESGVGPATNSESAAEREAREHKEDERLVDDELRKYVDEGPAVESSNFDLLKYWEVSLAKVRLQWTVQRTDSYETAT